MSFFRHRSLSDFSGIFASLLCLAHCLIVPLFFAGYAAAGEHVHEEGEVHFHADSFFSWDYVFILLGFLAVWHSARRTKIMWIRLILWGSFSLFVLAVFLESYSSLWHYGHYAAALGLIIGHVANLMTCNRCETSHKVAKS
ncbi:MAG: MerC domain-containing protein [Bernardetiaceae bacterium]|nr:MerC domain-containing protein [Bernardetiaceae bacterium]